MDLDLQWFYAFNQKGVCWDRTTNNLNRGELRLGLDADRNLMTVYVYTAKSSAAGSKGRVVSALAACKEALEAKTIEMRTKIQHAMDLVAAVREASLGGAAEVAQLLPLVGAFYTRRKDSCSVCGSDDAVALKVRPGTATVVCSTACGAARRSESSRSIRIRSRFS